MIISETQFEEIFGFDISFYLSEKKEGVYYFKEKDKIVKVTVYGFKTKALYDDVDRFPQMEIEII